MKKNVEEITKQLEEGVKSLFESNDYADYLKFMSKFYKYSANNCLLIYLQMPEASLVAGYKAWQAKFKRQVKKGAKGITILAPCPHKMKKLVVDADGNETEKEIQGTTYRAVSVFDISQTDGDDVPSICKTLDGSVENYEEIFDKLIKISPVRVVFENIGGGANGYYNFVEQKIAVKSGMSELQTIKTIVHEIAHAKLHNKDDGEQKDADSRKKEVQAESVAYTVLSFLGLDASDYSFGYVAGWSKGKDCKELSDSMEAIRKTAGSIIDELLTKKD